MTRTNRTTNRFTTSARRGAAAVELALLLPLLVLLFALAVDFARVFYATQVLQSAAGTGASYASGTAWVPSSTSATDAAKTAAVTEGAMFDPPLRADQVTVTTTGSTVTVTVEYDFRLVTGFLTPNGTIPLRRTVTTRVAPRPGD